MSFKASSVGLACFAFSVGTAYAHHNIERTYDVKQEVVLDGKIRQLLLRNPHSFLQIEVSNQGQSQIWSVEFPKGANSLAKEGIKPGILKIGDQVTVTMNPPRKPGSTLGSLVLLRRESDRFEWSHKKIKAH